ncbi:MAG: glutathione S-transferase C-terminal domain-containing protein [Spirulinaceae cyanobacterium]
MATGMLIEGKWNHEKYQKDSQGRFKRNPTTFRDSITAEGSSGFKAEVGRYHLYVSYACPWAHRTLLLRKLKGLMDAIYQPINNGVYRAGFASSQTAYEEAVTELFSALDAWEEVLGKQRYLCGDRLTEADFCLFTTLLRFDQVYYVHFKCNLRHIWDYPHLWNYLKDLYQHPGVKETCNHTHIKRHYYESHPHINPSGLVAKGPIIDFE